MATRRQGLRQQPLDKARLDRAERQQAELYAGGGGGGAGATGADPTASIGTVMVPGSAGTFMRSDAAPPLDLAITPTWTGVHVHLGALACDGGSATGLNTGDPTLVNNDKSHAFKVDSYTENDAPYPPAFNWHAKGKIDNPYTTPTYDPNDNPQYHTKWVNHLDETILQLNLDTGELSSIVHTGTIIHTKSNPAPTGDWAPSGDWTPSAGEWDLRALSLLYLPDALDMPRVASSLAAGYPLSTDIRLHIVDGESVLRYNTSSSLGEVVGGIVYDTTAPDTKEQGWVDTSGTDPVFPGKWLFKLWDGADWIMLVPFP